MPKRRRLFTPNKHKIKSNNKGDDTEYRNTMKTETDAREEVNTARGRFKGALKDVLEPLSQDDSEDSSEGTPVKRERLQSEDNKEIYLSDEEAKKVLRKFPPRQSYVLKLFDRSVDLSQFQDDSPLYPICRAWMANQPKSNYSENANASSREEDWEGDIELPGPEGPPVPKTPALLPEQAAANKNNINLNYREAPPPSREHLLRQHMSRWAAVKLAWQEQIALKEARYEGTQQILNRINLEYLAR